MHQTINTMNRHGDTVDVGKIPLLQNTNWSKQTCLNKNHRCQNPFTVANTVVAGTESKRQTLIYKMYYKQAVPDDDRSDINLRQLVFFRKLKNAEKRFIQNIPNDFVFPTNANITKNDLQKMIGNAIPPRFATCIIRGVISVIPNLKNKTYLDLFSGIGGMSMGFQYSDDRWFSKFRAGVSKTRCTKRYEFYSHHKKSKRLLKSNGNLIKYPVGFECLALIEIDKKCCNVLKGNRKYICNSNDPSGSCCKVETGDCDCFKKKIHNVDIQNFNFSKFEGNVGILTGGPPCQPFSRLGKKLGLDDFRNKWDSCAKIIFLTEPEAFIFENAPFLSICKKFLEKDLIEIKCMLSDPVKYLTNTFDTKRIYVNSLDREVKLKLINLKPHRPFNFKWLTFRKIFNAKNYGVCQQRKRTIFVGIRIECNFKYDFFTNSQMNPILAIEKFKIHPTVNQATVTCHDLVKSYTKHHKSDLSNWCIDKSPKSFDLII